MTKSSEREAARAEVERLQRELQIEREYAVGARDALAEVQNYSRERHAKLRADVDALTAEVARLRGENAALLKDNTEAHHADRPVRSENRSLRAEVAVMSRGYVWSKVAALIAERDRMRPVVEAARRWHHELSGTDFGELSATLQMAVLEYEAARAGEKEST